MPIYAIMDALPPSTCIHSESRDDPPPVDFYVNVPDGDPIPQAGWTFDGNTWTQPPEQVAVAQAADTLNNLVNQASALQDQITADLALFANTPVGSTLSQDHLDALQRIVAGFITVQQTVIAQGILVGAIPPLAISIPPSPPSPPPPSP